MKNVVYIAFLIIFVSNNIFPQNISTEKILNDPKLMEQIADLIAAKTEQSKKDVDSDSKEEKNMVTKKSNKPLNFEPDDLQRDLNIKLFKAIQQQDLKEVKELVEKGAQVDAKTSKLGETPLIFAGLYQSPDIVRFLLNKGADINKKDDFGLTPLMVAIIVQNFDMVKLLVEEGKADLEVKDNRGKIALEHARIWPSEEIFHYVDEKTPNHTLYPH